MTRHLRLLALALPLGLVTCGGGGAKSNITNTTVSKGQQLIDLKKALDAGAIQPHEFRKAKKQILSSR